MIPQLPLDRLIETDDRIDSDWYTQDHVARLRSMLPEMVNFPDGTLLHLWYEFSMNWMYVGCQHERTAQFVDYLIAVLIEGERDFQSPPKFLTIRLVLNGLLDGLSFDQALGASTSHERVATR